MVNRCCPECEGSAMITLALLRHCMLAMSSSDDKRLLMRPMNVVSSANLIMNLPELLIYTVCSTIVIISESDL